MEVIEQKRQALMKENLLIQMMDAQRTHVNDELIKILFDGRDYMVVSYLMFGVGPKKRSIIL
jgi:hypothetical protein